ncbi:MAG: hypothetical protein JNK82_19810 [Myxococcaceae bacterium]|nr:hypothetical protein [Myxococcaceae bacterium]
MTSQTTSAGPTPAPTSAGSTPGSGFTGASTFESTAGTSTPTGAGREMSEIPQIKDGLEVLRGMEGNSAASQALEILSRNKIPTKAEFETLMGKDGESGLLAELKGSLSEEDFKKVQDAMQQMQVMKGLGEWIMGQVKEMAASINK